MDNELREKAKNEMRLILEAAGYTVSDVDDPLDLSAIREGGCLLVLCSNDENTIAGFNKTNYNLKIEVHIFLSLDLTILFLKSSTIAEYVNKYLLRFILSPAGIMAYCLTGLACGVLSFTALFYRLQMNKVSLTGHYLIE